METNAVVVLKGRGGVFRLGKSDVEVFRGGLSRWVPLAALTGHETSGRTVVLTTAEETYTVEGRNDASVTAFTEALTRAMRKVKHDPKATISSTTQSRRPMSLLMKLGLAAGVFALLVLWWAGLPNGLIILAGLGVLGLLSWLAFLAVRGTWRLLLGDLWTLHRRGVTVRGRITEYRDSTHDQTKHAKLQFVTANGRSMRIESPIVVFLKREPGEADITYDPKNPELAYGQPPVGQLLIGLLFGLLSLALAAVPVAGLGYLGFGMLKIYGLL